MAATCSSVLLALLLHSVVAVRYIDRLSCPVIACYRSTELRNCKFNNSSDIECTMYSVSRAESKILPVKSILEYRTVFYLQQSSPIKTCLPSHREENSFCLGIRSTLLRIVDDIPEPKDEANQFTFPDDITQNLKIAKFGSYLYIEFYSNLSAGFVSLNPECNYQTGDVMENSCIQELKASNLVISPGEIIRDEPTDDQFDKSLELYLTVMGGRMKELSLSTNIPSTGVNASLFLQFLTPTRVERLNVSDNSFSGDLPHRLFSLNDLTELYISGCGMSSIDPGNFMNTPNLRILDISLNQLKEVPKGLSTLTQLEDLDLSGQRIGTPFMLTKEMYTMKKLRSLKMSRLQTLQNIYREAYPKNLEYLDHSNCGVSNLQSDTFSDLHLLKILILSNNNIATIPSNIFKPLKSLSKLYLNNNKIGNNPQITIDTIDTLDLSKNKIKTPNKLISEGTIQNLNLSRNDIVNWTGEYVFHSKKFKITHLNLSYNHMTIVNDVMERSLQLLESVDIGGNIINCIDCSIKSFQNWLRGNHSKILNLNSTEDLTCNEPYTLYGKSVLEVQYNSTLCDVIAPDYALIFGTPFGILLILLTTSIILGYMYRFEIAYVRHLFNVKKRNEREEKQGCVYDLFVSYSSKDREWVVNVLLEKLESAEEGYQLCLHERDFLLGTYIMDNVVNCIEKSRRTLLVLTENYIESEWCRWELQMAQHRVFEISNDFLILLELKRLDREKLPLHLRQLMVSRTYLEWPNDLTVSKQENFWARLKAALGKPLTHMALDFVPGEPEVVLDEQEEDPWLIAMRAAEGSREQFLTAIGLTDDFTL